ncbi:hypothetical protein OJF2_77970 [Aquisphaera giovannonii]|uniref:Uncharacterized protein n=1 Tax=Aquisphaera giovannonii TaxID=406548 RepID=A0A5B9WGQ8_9BACT|nr:hypothetical protein [Aquisphaera giovannonii]QEH39185.1 hypothetical protein OJF2_77970 [Aquisphaera giovannonii]
MPHRFHFRIRTALVAVAVLAVAMAYVGSYDRLKRRGLRQAADYGYPGLPYVDLPGPVDGWDFGRHCAWAIFYEPLNLVDRRLFGGSSHWACLFIMTRLDG